MTSNDLLFSKRILSISEQMEFVIDSLEQEVVDSMHL